MQSTRRERTGWYFSDRADSASTDGGSCRIASTSLLVCFVAGFVGLAGVPIRRAVEPAGNTPPARP